jgi:transmembrane sensor
MNNIHHAIEDAAAAWDARLRGGKATFQDRQAFHAWLQEDAEHRAAHDRLQAALAMLRLNAELPELSALRDEARNSVHESRRRRLVSVVALAVAAVLLVVLVTVTNTEIGADMTAMAQGETIYATSPNERTRVTLADGSVVTLDSGSRLSARLGMSRRDITLLAGRALFQVAKDRHRPFVVKAGDRTITALGTVFDVRLSPNELRVTLAEGSVVVRPVHPSRGSTQQVLKPNQQLVEVAGEAVPELRTIDMDKALSWADGQVFFEDEPLRSAVEEMNQYSNLKIMVDPAVANLRINGMFRIRNQNGFLDALEIALPVKVRRDEHGQVFVSRRAEPDAE